MSSLIEHAEHELDLIGLTKDSDNEWSASMRDSILNTLKAFSDENHSDLSASYAIHILHDLLQFKPLSPLTGNDDEWAHVADENGVPLYQNKRCSHVFKSGDRAYDIDGIAFYGPEFKDVDPTERPYYMCYKSRVDIDFPYTPTTKYEMGEPEN